MDIFLIRNKKKLGLGFALKKGFENAKFSNVMFLDADLSIKLKDILRIVKYKNKNTMIIGSRYLRKSKIIGANYVKVKLSFILNYLISKLYNLKIIDISHSFRIISKNIKLYASWFLLGNNHKCKTKRRECPRNSYNIY